MVIPLNKSIEMNKNIAQGGIQRVKQEHVLRPGPEFSIKVYWCTPYGHALVLAPLDTARIFVYSRPKINSNLRQQLFKFINM